VPGPHADVGEDAPQQVSVQAAQFSVRSAIAFFAHQFGQALRYFAYRQDEVSNSGCNRAARHRREFGFVGILHQDDAAGFLDGPHADRAVGPGTGQDDGATVAVLFRQGAEEQVDRRPLPARLLEFRGGDFVVADVQPPVGRDDINMIRFSGTGSPTWRTGICVRAARMFDISLRRSGWRCTTTTKAAPVFSGNAANSCCNARTPPAEAPIPTTFVLVRPGSPVSFRSSSLVSAIEAASLTLRSRTGFNQCYLEFRQGNPVWVNFGTN
jgi:hypothetical protein